MVDRRHVFCFATQGLESKEKGKFTREELSPLAKVNVESLKEFDYFTFATADGKKAPLTDPLPDYWLDYTNEVLDAGISPCHSRRPVKAKELKLDIYDPTIFVDFSFDKKRRYIWSAPPPAASSISRCRAR